MALISEQMNFGGYFTKCTVFTYAKFFIVLRISIWGSTRVILESKWSLAEKLFQNAHSRYLEKLLHSSQDTILGINLGQIGKQLFRREKGNTLHKLYTVFTSSINSMIFMKSGIKVKRVRAKRVHNVVSALLNIY
jgi:hypothetical protein